MQRTRSVVVGYDGTGRARSALTWAAREAASRGLPLRVIRAVPYAAAPVRIPASAPEGTTPEADAVLVEGIRLARTLLAEGQVSGSSIAGHPAGVLSEASDHAALVVVGQRSQDAPVSSAIGSTSTVLADRARCPVVVARGATGPERFALPVVVGVTRDPSSQAALDFAAYTAQIRQVPLTVVVAWSLPPARQWSRGAAGFDTVAQCARDLSAGAAAVARASEEHVTQHYPGVVTRTRVEELEVVTALERASRGAGLLVVGARGRQTAHRGARTLDPGRGPVVREVLGRAACPAVVVPAGSAATDVVAAVFPDGADRGVQTHSSTHTWTGGQGVGRRPLT